MTERKKGRKKGREAEWKTGRKTGRQVERQKGRQKGRGKQERNYHRKRVVLLLRIGSFLIGEVFSRDSG